MDDGRPDDRRIAIWYRVLRFALLAAFAALVGLAWLPWSTAMCTLLLAVPSAVVFIASDQMLRAQRKSGTVRGSYLLLLFVPFFNFFAVLLLLDQAADDLRRRGLRVAWHGVRHSEWIKLLPNHCMTCGYDRAGLEGGAPCPECGAMPDAVDRPTTRG